MDSFCPTCGRLLEPTDGGGSSAELRCPDCATSVCTDPDETRPWDTAADGPPGAAGAVRLNEMVAHYRVVERLGHGGMGVVFKAQDTRLGRYVALKFLTDRHGRDQAALKRFRREARTASELNHPHICTIHDVIESGGRPFIVMELLDGHTLKSHIGGRPLPPAEVLRLGGQILDALEAAHARGIIHRDIKPANIFVTARGEAKVLDFGLAKPEGPPDDGPVEVAGTAAPADETVSRPGAVVGTLAYMSPEQALGRAVDARSDLFSFGIVLYEMATGARPSTGSTTSGPTVVGGGPAPARALNPALAPGLDRVITRALAPAPPARYQSAAEFRRDLAGLGPAPVSPTRPWWWMWLGVAALVVAVAVVAVWRPPADPPSPTPPRIIPFTALQGEEFNPAFSPDGGQIAFTWSGEDRDNFDVYVQPVPTGSARRLTTHADPDVNPTWSPDGNQIAFARYTDSRRDILVVPAAGGTETTLITGGPGPPDPTSPLAWSPDGTTLAFSDRPIPGAAASLYLYVFATGQRRPLTTAPDRSVDTGPRFSPNGEWVAFTRRAGRVEDIYLVAVATGDVRPLTTDKRDIKGLDWTEDGREIVFVAGKGGRDELWRVPVDGGPPVVVPGFGDTMSGLTVARRGNRLAFSRRTDDRNIWRLDLSVTDARPVRLIASTRDETLPQYSPDGKSIAFGSTRSGHPEIWRCAADGSNPELVTGFGGPVTITPRWSPDGRELAFESQAAGNGDIYVIGATGGPPRRLTDDPAEDTAPSWSRDGQWVYFGSNRSGTQQVWKVPAAGGAAVQVTTGGGLAAFESADGARLYFWRGGAEPGIWWRPVAGGPETRLHPAVKPHYWGSWGLTADALYFLTESITPDHVRKGSVVSMVRRYVFATGQVADMAALERPSLGLAVSADGRAVLYAQYDQRGSDIFLAEGFK